MKVKNAIEPRWVQINRDRSLAKYYNMKRQNHLIHYADSLLKSLSDIYGLGVFIPLDKFLEVDFPFGVSTAIRSKYSDCDIVVEKFCYVIFKNHTIKIYKS